MWFILHDGQVLGPFDKEEVHSQITTLKDIQIWGKGLSEWVLPEKWVKNLQRSESLSANAEQTEKVWKWRLENREMKALPEKQLIDELKRMNDLGAVDLFSEEDRRWKDLYTFHEITDKLGISRRVNPRVPIMALLKITNKKLDREFKVNTISVGGLGINGSKHISLGDTLKGVLKSDVLNEPISLTLEVVYLGQDGYAGFKFLSISEEHQALITEYVNKFT